MDWNKLSKNLLKSELQRKGMNYEQLSQKLSSIGVHESSAVLNRKINRGVFQFSFFLQCVTAMGLKTLHLDEINQEK